MSKPPAWTSLGAALFATSPALGQAAEVPFGDDLRDLIGRPGGLTPEIVAERAVRTSHPIAARAHAREAARAETEKAELGYIPRLALLARYTRLSSIEQPDLGHVVAAPGAPEGPLLPGTPLSSVPIRFPAILDQTLLQASLTVPLSDYVLRVPYAIGGAARAEESASEQVSVETANVRLRSHVVYYAWVRARLHVLAAERNLAQTRLYRDAVRARADAGSTPHGDLLSVEARVGGAELLLERARSGLGVAEDQLRTLMHDPAGSYEIGVELDTAVEESTGSVEELFVEAREARAELRALDARASAVHAHASAALAARLPRLDAFGDVYLANPNSRLIPPVDRFEATWDAGVQLSFTLNDLLGAGPTADSLEAHGAELAARRGELEDAIRSEIVEARLDLVRSRAALNAAARAIAAAEESHRVKSELYAVGRTTDLAVIGAESRLLEARLEWIDALVDLRVARAKLDHGAGR